MSAPLVVNTTDGTCWTRRTVTSSGIALYAPEGVCSCPEFVMATLAELAEHGISGSADVLPVPVGPQMPDFPPPPTTEVEKLHSERARLQGLLADAVADSHRARRERDEMRERVSEPYGCTHCGITKRVHGRRWTTGVGVHGWEPPTQAQIAERMKARRTVRVALDNERLRARVAELEQLTPASIQTCRVCGAGYTYGEPCNTCEFQARMAAEAGSAAGWSRLYATPAALREETPAETPGLAVYRAGFEHHDIPLGLYDNAAAARAHCEAYVRREYPAGTPLAMRWCVDEDDSNIVELDVEAGGRTESTGYIVTAVPLLSDFDGEADE